MTDTLLRPSPRRWVIDLMAVAVSVADMGVAMWTNELGMSALPIACVVGAVVGVLIRNDHPLIGFVLTLPAVGIVGALAAPAITLFAVARHTERVAVVALCVVTSAVMASLSEPLPQPDRAYEVAVALAYFTAGAAAPAFFGRMTRLHHALRRRLDEIDDIHAHERQLYAQTVLSRERAQIGREMHDVVSHQVTLIAVRAATILVDPSPQRARTEAETIRGLAVSTLEELRHLVTLLRASGGSSSDTSTAPQPEVSDLRALIDNSGIDVRELGRLPTDLPGAWQRTIYRTVQESLTNTRKHAPGAGATIRYTVEEPAHLVVTITNSPAQRPALALPGAGHGLIGLRERAELLGGTLTADPSPDGGFTVTLTLPLVSVNQSKTERRQK